MAYLFRHGKGKRFCLLFLVMVVPCAIPAYFFPFSRYISFFFDYSHVNYSNWGELWLGLFNSSVPALCSMAVGFIILVPTVAYVTTVITRHVRVGEFTFPHLLYSVNENFFPSLAAVFFYVIATFSVHTLYTLFQFMWTLISGYATSITLSIISFLLLFVLLMFILSSAALWLPTMSFTGMYVFRALGLSFTKSRDHKEHLGTACVAGLITLALAIAAHFLQSIWYVAWIVNTLTYTFLAVFFITYNILSYCESESLNREDLAKSYFGR